MLCRYTVRLSFPKNSNKKLFFFFSLLHFAMSMLTLFVVRWIKKFPFYRFVFVICCMSTLAHFACVLFHSFRTVSVFVSFGSNKNVQFQMKWRLTGWQIFYFCQRIEIYDPSNKIRILTLHRRWKNDKFIALSHTGSTFW